MTINDVHRPHRNVPVSANSTLSVTFYSPDKEGKMKILTARHNHKQNQQAVVEVFGNHGPSLGKAEGR